MKEDGPHGIRRNVLRQLPPKSGSLSAMDTEQAELPPQHPRRDQTGYQVGNRHTYPYACLTKIPGQDQQTGNQYQHLTGDRQKDSFTRHPDALEEVRRHHLEPDYRKEQHHNPKSFGRLTDQFFVGSKDRYGQAGDQHSHQETRSCYNGGSVNGKLQHTGHPGIEPGAEIISGYGLHPLVQPHHNHHKQENKTIDNTKRTDSKISAIFFQPLVNQDYDKTRRKVHQERSHTDGERVEYDFPFQPENAPMKMEQLFLIAE